MSPRPHPTDPRAAEPSEVTVPVMSECVQALTQHQEGCLLDTESETAGARLWGECPRLLGRWYISSQCLDAWTAGGGGKATNSECFLSLSPPLAFGAKINLTV